MRLRRIGIAIALVAGSAVAAIGLACSSFGADGETPAVEGGVEANLSEMGPGPIEPGPDARPAYRDVVIADRPFAYWRLADPLGSKTIADEMGMAPGTVIGAVELGVAGAIPGNAAVELKKGDVDGCIKIGDLSALRFRKDSSFTLEAWIRADTFVLTEQRRVIGKVSGSDGYALDLVNARPRIFLFDDGGTGSLIADASLVTDAFTHVVATFEGPANRLKLFVDGSLDGTKELGAKPGNNSVPVAIGCRITGQDNVGTVFDGVIDEVAIYDRALPIDRIKAHFEAR